MFYFLCFFAASHTDPKEFPLFDMIPGIGEMDISREDDVVPTSKYAFVTCYSADDHWNHFLLSVVVLGHSLASLSPKYDRVLVLPSKMEFDAADMKKLHSAWTHIIKRPFVKFSCDGIQMKDPKDAQIWFKLQIFSLYQYSRVLYLCPHAFVTQDLSEAFTFFPPSAPPDYQTWGYSHLGAVRNTDFLVVSPSQMQFDNITKKACEWIKDPVGRSKELQEKYASDRNQQLGPYDNGLLEDFYYGRFTTIPSYYQFEITNKQAPISKTDPRIRTYRFSFGLRPWDNGPGQKKDIIAQAYTAAIAKTYEYFNETLEYTRFQLEKPEDPNANFISNRWKEPLAVKSYQVFNFYDEIVETSIWREISRYGSLVIGGMGLIGFAIADAPLSSRDEQDGGLMDEE